MMREGTKTRSSQQISQDLETLAATVTVGSGASGVTATVGGGSLTEDFPRVFDIAADVLLNPSFPAGEVGPLEDAGKGGPSAAAVQPGFPRGTRCSTRWCSDTPSGGAASVPTPKRSTRSPPPISRVTTDALRARPRRVAFAGDITLDQARSLTTKYLGDMEASGNGGRRK